MQIDTDKVRRESIRWLIMLTLNNARPDGHYDGPVLSVAQAIYPDATKLELRREIQYLASRNMVLLKVLPSGPWHCNLTSAGVDCAEYTSDCAPGIARPAKYW